MNILDSFLLLQSLTYNQGFDDLYPAGSELPITRQKLSGDLLLPDGFAYQLLFLFFLSVLIFFFFVGEKFSNTICECSFKRFHKII